MCSNESIIPHLLDTLFICFDLIFFCEEKIPVRVTAPRFELTSQRQMVSRLPTEPLGRPVCELITLHMNALPGPVIEVILCHSHWSSQGKGQLYFSRKSLIRREYGDTFSPLLQFERLVRIFMFPFLFSTPSGSTSTKPTHSCIICVLFPTKSNLFFTSRPQLS